MDTSKPYFTQLLKTTVSSVADKKREPLFLCIGTDRSTGDALGPLVGTGLAKKGFLVFGTLNKPVHGVNIYTVIDEIACIKNKQVIAVDAGLGKNVGCVSLWQGSLLPGAGISKSLPSVGEVGIMGVVAGYSTNAVNTLQNVRLSGVVNMAQLIVEGITRAYK